MTISSFIAQSLNLSIKSVESTLRLLDEGGTVPFISRYRKEQTGNLDEVQIAQIQKLSAQFKELEKRKQTIIDAITEQGALTEALQQKIDACYDANELEDLYLPYKVKRKTKATIAKERGLEPLAKMIMAQNDGNPVQWASRFVNKEVPDSDQALEGAQDILAEWISEHASLRNRLRQLFVRNAVLKVKKGKTPDTEGKYQDYTDWSEPLHRCPSHRFLAIYRASGEGILSMHATPDDEEALGMVKRQFVKGRNMASGLVEEAGNQSYKKLIKPSLENERIGMAKEKADKQAIEVFKDNLRQLLMAPPVGQLRTMGIDPGYRTGCKVVCIDEKGDLLANTTIFPHPPQSDFALSSKRITSLAEQYKIEAIAIGNGTASRETELFIKKLTFHKPLQVFMVSEDGASVYSASKVGREEFPDYDVTVRGAVSIARRLTDPLSELVKIDPKSLGVGQYQHEVDQKELKEGLDFTVVSVVNQIGVNLNSSSPYLLQYVAGLNASSAKKICDYRTETGMFTSRDSIKKVPGIGPKTYEQAAGFLMVPQSANPLDHSRVHPERYKLIEKMAKSMGLTTQELIGNTDAIAQIEIDRFIDENTGKETLNDIVKELRKKGLDPRQNVKMFEFDPSIRKFEDVKVGMILPGMVTNVTNFGAFVDIGIKENGLLHLSQMAERFIENPGEIVKLHQTMQVRIHGIDAERRRIQLSIIGL